MDILSSFFFLPKNRLKSFRYRQNPILANNERQNKNKLDLFREIIKKIINEEHLSEFENEEINYIKLLSELIGIILGDGNIRKYSFRIDLNKIDEIDYVNYVINLIYQVLGKYPKRRDRRGIDESQEGKGIRLIINSKEIIDLLVKIGLKIGHKIRNNAKVPDWFLRKTNLIPFILRGLFDTDGNIDIHKKWSSLTLRFVSGSQILIKNFKSMCEILDIKISNIRKIKIKSEKYNKVYDASVVSIGSKAAVSKFLEISRPRKFLYRKKLIAMILFILSDPERTKIINKERIKYFPNRKKINQFTVEYLDFLQKVFKKYNWKINNKLVENLINEALTLKTHNYQVANAKKFKDLFEKLGTVKCIVDFYMSKGEKLDSHIIKKHIKKLLSGEKFIKIFENSQYNPLEVLGDSFYDKWDKNNFRIIVDKRSRKVLQFNSNLRIKIALEIFKFLKKYRESFPINSDLIINHLKGLIEKSPFLGRLNYLINDRHFSIILIEYLRQLVVIVKEIINNPGENAFQISKKTGFKRDTIQNIINEIKKKE